MACLARNGWREGTQGRASVLIALDPEQLIGLSLGRLGDAVPTTAMMGALLVSGTAGHPFDW